MHWALPDYAARPNDEEIYNQMSRRNGLDVPLLVNSGRDDDPGVVGDEHNRMLESIGVTLSGRNVDRNGGDTSDVAHSIFQLANLARRKFAQHYQTGRKLDFTPAKRLEKVDCDNAGDRCNESKMNDEERFRVLDSLHIQHGRLTNREIAFILAIRAITGSTLPCTYICAPITGRPSYLFRRRRGKLLID